MTVLGFLQLLPGEGLRDGTLTYMHFLCSHKQEPVKDPCLQIVERGRKVRVCGLVHGGPVAEPLLYSVIKFYLFIFIPCIAK